ncbi:MAG: hypothetical protein EXS10_02085 [Phycisphaerales bacterium]|nr:hypothetical protein [Phycisphaerales bacterium]
MSVSTPAAHTSQPVRALPIAAVTFFCSLGTGILWNSIYFVAESIYSFTQTESMLLAFVNGVLYTIVALNAGRIVRALERHMSPRTALACILAAQALLAPIVLVVPTVEALWVCAVTMTALGALQWPIVQHYLVSGRHGAQMRNAIGWWNASWMSATAIGLALTGPLEAAGLLEYAIPAMLPVLLLAMCFLPTFPAYPARHDPDAQAAHVPSSYAPLLRSARVLHPMGYLVIGALSPVLPYLFHGLNIDAAWHAPISSTWHVARLLAVLFLWQTVFWHGRGGTLFVAGVLLSGGFALTATSANEMTLVVGLVALGLGQGAIYYNAIYYAMAVGSAEVEAGGTHEALVGIGYFSGPMIGLLAAAAGAGTPVFIALVLGVLLMGGIYACFRMRASAPSSVG